MTDKTPPSSGSQSSSLSPQSSVLSPPSSSLSPSSVAHIVPLRVLFAVWIALLILTVVTVAVAGVDLGRASLWVAIAIAVVKASLVAMYFMHLRYDHPFHAIILILSLLFVMLFIGLAIMDTGQYQPEIRQWQSDQAAPT